MMSKSVHAINLILVKEKTSLSKLVSHCTVQKLHSLHATSLHSQNVDISIHPLAISFFIMSTHSFIPRPWPKSHDEQKSLSDVSTL